MVVVALTLMFSHELKMGDVGASWTCWHRRLVHVQGAGKCRVELLQIKVAVLQPVISSLQHSRLDRLVVPANWWIQVLHVRG